MKSIPHAYLVFKVSGQSSQSLINQCRRQCGEKKVGHVGTLDRLAQGLMILLTWRATSLANLFLQYRKSYFCQFDFGRNTDTHDSAGETVLEWSAKKTQKVVQEKRDEIIQWISAFKQRSSQKAPLFSALKYQGRRYSDRARSGERDFFDSIPARDISITRSSLLNLTEHSLQASFEVSSGTYIRAIARDLGQELQIPLHLSFLHRQSIGHWQCPITVNTSRSIEQAMKKIKENPAQLQNQFNPITLDSILADWPQAQLKSHECMLKKWPNHITRDDLIWRGRTAKTFENIILLYCDDLNRQFFPLGWVIIDQEERLKIKRVFLLPHEISSQVPDRCLVK